MIRDITIGQYYPAKSVLHRLDPRTKFLGTLGFLISVFLFHTFLGYAVATVFLVAMIAISKVPVKFMFKGLKAIVMILLITVVFNIILTPGEVLWRFGIIKVTKEGLVLAGRMAIRLVYLVIGSSIIMQPDGTGMVLPSGRRQSFCSFYHLLQTNISFSS